MRVWIVGGHGYKHTGPNQRTERTNAAVYVTETEMQARGLMAEALLSEGFVVDQLVAGEMSPETMAAIAQLVPATA